MVLGTGMIAALLRSLVKGFNVKKRIKIERSNEQCLPRPSKLPKSYVFKIFGTYLSIWLMLWVQTYTQRTRRLICSYFFRKREKTRVLFLYNQTLKRRIGFRKYDQLKLMIKLVCHTLSSIEGIWRETWTEKRGNVAWRKTTMYFKFWRWNIQSNVDGWSFLRWQEESVW